MESSPVRYNPWLHRYTTLVASATFLLLIAGALVTSNDAGLSVPDWPTSFGSLRMPPMVGGVLYEHGHRMIAGAVALLTIVLGLWLWRSEARPWALKLGGFAVLTVFAQALLGGLTVLLYLPVAVSVTHACLAQTFFCIVVSLALFTSEDWSGVGHPWDDARPTDLSLLSLRSLCLGTTAVIFVQLMLGAAFRHNGLGIVPHVVVAVVATMGVLWVTLRILNLSPRERRLTRRAALLVSLLVLQILLGIGSYALKVAARNAPQPLPPVVVVTTAHVAVGALVLAASVVLTLEVFRAFRAPGRIESRAKTLAAERAASL